MAISIVFSVSLVSCIKSINIEAENRNRAEIIISALYEFQQVHSRFPNSLIELSPEFLESIPVTVCGDDFLYRENSVYGFYIFFEVRLHYGCGFTDQLQEWECSYGD